VTPRWDEEEHVRGGRAGGGRARGRRGGKRRAREHPRRDEDEGERVDGLVTSLGSRSTTVWIGARDEERRCAVSNLLWESERGESRPVAVGDRVVVRLGETEGGTIVEVAPRRSRLVRARVAGKDQRAGKTEAQVVAANVDRLIVVASLDEPPFRAGLVDRYVVAARSEGLEPIVCLNKVDLPGERAVAAPYRACGLDVIETSTVTGEGVEELARRMGDGISLLVGHSGVGKSSLLNAVSPDLDLETGEVTDYHGRGRHTTTRTTLLRLDRGGWVVDSPGTREFGLHGVEPAWAARLFPGFEGLADACRYGDCLHRDEPDCAVVAALQEGALDDERYLGYLRLLETLETDV